MGVQGAKPAWRGLGCAQIVPYPKVFWDSALETRMHQVEHQSLPVIHHSHLTSLNNLIG